MSFTIKVEIDAEGEYDREKVLKQIKELREKNPNCQIDLEMSISESYVDTLLKNMEDKK